MSNSNIRSQVVGYYVIGQSYYIDGDFDSAINYFKRGLQVSKDPYYSQFPRLFLGMSYLAKGEYLEAEEPLQQLVNFNEDFGTELIASPARALLGVVMMAKGQMAAGLRLFLEMRDSFVKNGMKYRVAVSEYVLGVIFSQIGSRSSPATLSRILKNIGFLAINGPLAKWKTERHFRLCIDLSMEIGANSLLGQTYLALGLIKGQKGKKEEAKKLLAQAMQIFEQCEIVTYGEKARGALESFSN